MKRYILLICVLMGFTASAQKTKLLMYNADWKPAKPKEAVYLVEQAQLNDTCWELNYYMMAKPRFLSVQFRNKEATILHGDYVSYRDDGHLDTIGYHLNGKKSYHWTVMAANNRTLKQLYYEDDVLKWTKDSTQLNEERKRRMDSIEKADGAKPKIEIESQFRDSLNGWRKYLTENLKYPKFSYDLDIQGTVMVQFIVNKEGKVEEPAIVKSVEYHLDKEAMRLIVQSPDWIPAVQNGRKVKSYKRQPIVFRLQYE